MTNLRTMIVCLSAAAATGCPGTLQDPASYGDDESANYEPDDYDGARDAASTGGPTPAADAGRSWDAATSEWRADASMPAASWGDAAARPSSGDAGMGWGDAAVRDDAGRGDAASMGGAEAGSSCDFRALMQARCGNASCHGGAMAPTGLDLTSAGLADRVRGQQASGACGQYLLIDREKPEESALYLKVSDDACGVRMPVGGMLSSSEQQCILQWIERL